MGRRQTRPPKMFGVRRSVVFFHLGYALVCYPMGLFCVLGACTQVQLAACRNLREPSPSTYQEKRLGWIKSPQPSNSRPFCSHHFIPKLPKLPKFATCVKVREWGTPWKVRWSGCVHLHLPDLRVAKDLLHAGQPRFLEFILCREKHPTTKQVGRLAVKLQDLSCFPTCHMAVATTNMCTKIAAW